MTKLNIEFADEHDIEVNALIERKAITSFQASTLNLALKDENPLIRSLALAFIAEPTKKRILYSLIDRFNVRIEGQYEYMLSIVKELLSGSHILGSSTKDFLLRLLASLTKNGERAVFRKTTLERLNELISSYYTDIPKIRY